MDSHEKSLSWNNVFAIIRQYLNGGRNEPDPSPWISAAFSLQITGIALHQVVAALPKSDLASQLRAAVHAVFPGPDDQTPKGPGAPRMGVELGLLAQSLEPGILRDRISVIAGQSVLCDLATQPRIVSASASNEFRSLGPNQLQLEVHGGGFTPDSKAMLVVNPGWHVAVGTGPGGQFDWVIRTDRSRAPCGQELTASCVDITSGIHSNSFPFQVFCV
jgi:hypothetical protein